MAAVVAVEIGVCDRHPAAGQTDTQQIVSGMSGQAMGLLADTICIHAQHTRVLMPHEHSRVWYGSTHANFLLLGLHEVSDTSREVHTGSTIVTIVPP